jgi:hypothetical protein
LQWYFSKRRTCWMRFLMSCCGYLSSLWPLSKCFILLASYICVLYFLDRFDLREENRKDVLRTLYALIDEANTANWSCHGRPLQFDTVAATSSWHFFSHFSSAPSRMLWAPCSSCRVQEFVIFAGDDCGQKFVRLWCCPSYTSLKKILFC